ncbi:hypothetical protein A3L11_09155 [Thermococcus siculi]|uniref:LamG-like jellyroll fold domain-containing protein n=1 Tax=Thermococcus siculi TaxID=72803 RepID=A0A2Z2MUB7_9EURY|nr:LamG-like jellyroll fold domain-containing protein [Thermococcus siculi]ASJ09386.1 hypothetical protein A3L11_09155 [Thermococcus siculi]
MKFKWFAVVVLVIDVIAIAMLVGAYMGGDDRAGVHSTAETAVPALALYTTPTGPVKLIDGEIVGDVEARNASVRVFHFNGSGYIDLSNALDGIGELREGSISMVFRYEETGQNVLPILYIGDKEGKSLFVIEIGHRGEHNRKLYVTWIPEGDKPALCFDSGFNLKPGRWYHLVVVSEDGNTAYLNGREMTWRHYNFGNESMRLFFGDIPGKELFALGYGKTADSITPDFLYFHGDIADLRVYPWPLSTGEVRELLEEIRASARS